MSKWLELARVLAPMLLMAAKVPPKLVPTVVDGITHVEQLGNATGAEKKARVLDLVADAVGVLNSVGKSGGLDPEDVRASVDKGIDATIGALNLIRAVHKAA